jgi:hypothetical protein
VTETGIAALHRYADGRPGSSRDHDAMLRAVYEQAVRHGHDPSGEATPMWGEIRASRLPSVRRSCRYLQLPAPLSCSCSRAKCCA